MKNIFKMEIDMSDDTRQANQQSIRQNIISRSIKFPRRSTFTRTDSSYDFVCYLIIYSSLFFSFRSLFLFFLSDKLLHESLLDRQRNITSQAGKYQNVNDEPPFSIHLNISLYKSYPTSWMPKNRHQLQLAGWLYTCC